MGFLFGIPRTLQSDAAPPGAGAAGGSAPQPQDYAQRVNTNLEQISDWLTKILVGLGLTQLGRVPDMIRDAAAYVASGSADPRSAAVGASAMIVYFSIMGFIGGYLLTRLFLAPAFAAADTSLKQMFAELKETVVETRLNSDLNAAILTARQNLRQDPPLTDSLEQDVRKLEQLRKSYPTHRTLHVTLDRLYDRLGRYDKCLEVANAFLDEKTRAGESYDKDVADVLYNRACTYASKSMRAQGAQKVELQDLALRDLKQSIDLSPENARQAASDDNYWSFFSTVIALSL